MKNARAILSSWAAQKQMVDEIQPVSHCLLTSVRDDIYTLKNCRNELLQVHTNLQLKLTDEHGKEYRWEVIVQP